MSQRQPSRAPSCSWYFEALSAFVFVSMFDFYEKRKLTLWSCHYL